MDRPRRSDGLLAVLAAVLALRTLIGRGALAPCVPARGASGTGSSVAWQAESDVRVRDY